MQDSGVPAKISVVWASSPDTGTFRVVPTTPPAQNGAASLQKGFPIATITPIAAGGSWPWGQDFNGILNLVTAWLQWGQAGGPMRYDATFSTAIGGYPKGATLYAAAGGFSWVSTVDNNASDPDTGGAGWFKDGPYLPLTGGILAGPGNLSVNGTATIATLGVTGNAGVNGGLSVVGQINTSNQILTNLGVISSGSINCGITAGNTNPVGSAQPGLVISPQGTLNSYSSGWVIGTATTNLIGLFSGSSAVGGITTNGSSVAFNTTSDYRLKVNVVPLTGATARINSVPVHRFNFSSQITESDLDPTPVDGFLAHEIALGVPESVTGTKDATATYANAVISGTTGAVLTSGVDQADWTAGKALEPPAYPVDSVWQATITVPVYQQVDQSKLTPVLWAAVQELSAAVTALQAQVAALTPHTAA
jgi:hypothetical protein